MIIVRIYFQTAQLFFVWYQHFFKIACKICYISWTFRKTVMVKFLNVRTFCNATNNFLNGKNIFLDISKKYYITWTFFISHEHFLQITLRILCIFVNTFENLSLELSKCVNNFINGTFFRKFQNQFSHFMYIFLIRGERFLNFK